MSSTTLSPFTLPSDPSRHRSASSASFASASSLSIPTFDRPLTPSGSGIPPTACPPRSSPIPAPSQVDTLPSTTATLSSRPPRSPSPSHPLARARARARARSRSRSPGRSRVRLSYSRHRIPVRVAPMRKCANGHLMPPLPTRNFAISPPPSPPENWVSFEEDGPNMMPHADDIAARLDALALASGAGQYCVFDPEVHYSESESDDDVDVEVDIEVDITIDSHVRRSPATSPTNNGLTRTDTGPVAPLNRRGFVIPPIFVISDESPESMSVFDPVHPSAGPSSLSSFLAPRMDSHVLPKTTMPPV